MRDLRSFLMELDADELRQVTRCVEPAAYEVTALLQHLEDSGRYPALLFDSPSSVNGHTSAFRLLSNLFADRRRVAKALDLAADDWKMATSLEYARREKDLREPVVVSPDDAPVRQREVPDLTHLPIVRHHQLDPAPYIDMTPVMRDPLSGVYNVAFLRNMLQGPMTLGIHMSPRHNHRIFAENESHDRVTPVAIVAGHHPGFYLGALTLAGFDTDEYHVIGGLLGESLRVTPSVTWGEDFLVPADAEVVIEGEIRPGEREVEAPFGEFTRYYGPQRLRPVIHVRHISARTDAIFQHVFVGHRDNWVLGGVPKEGGTYSSIKSRVPGVHQVHLPNSGCGRFRCYVSLRQQSEGEARQAGLQAMASSDFVKQVVVTDTDIDVFDEEQVLWAVATRCRADEDIDIIRNVKGNTLDPSVRGEVSTSKVIIDATVPVSESYPPAVKVPPEVLATVRPDDYID